MPDEKNYVRFVRDIAEALCQDPQEIEVQDSIDERGVLIELFVSKADLPRMIGKKGDTAMAIRHLLRALGAKDNARYSFKVNSRTQE